MRRAVLRAAALAALLVLAGGVAWGCAADPQDPGLLPGPAEIDVDTPELRQMKAELGVEDDHDAPGRHLDRAVERAAS